MRNGVPRLTRLSGSPMRRSATSRTAAGLLWNLLLVLVLAAFASTSVINTAEAQRNFFWNRLNKPKVKVKKRTIRKSSKARFKKRPNPKLTSIPRPRLSPLRLRAIKLSSTPVPRDPPRGRLVETAKITTGTITTGAIKPNATQPTASTKVMPIPPAMSKPVAAPKVTTTSTSPDLKARPAKSPLAVLKFKPGRQAGLTIRPTVFITPENGKGKQGIILNAKLTGDRKTIERKINWSVYRIDGATKKKWQKIAQLSSPTARFELGTGDYVVRAEFGHASASTFVPVTAGNISRTQVIFNAGGLRIVPALAFLDTPKGKTVRISLIKLSQAPDERRAAIIAPGKIVRLNAGLYKITSKLGTVNAETTTQIVIKPGMLTDVEINHKAAIVNFRLVEKTGSMPLDNTHWQLMDATGKLLAKDKTTNPVHVLAPGTYKLTVAHNKKRYTKEFKVGVGDKKSIEILAGQ